MIFFSNNHLQKQDLTGKIKWHMAIDCRKLNNKTIDDKYPLPQTDSIPGKLEDFIEKTDFNV